MPPTRCNVNSHEQVGPLTAATPPELNFSVAATNGAA